VIWQIRPQWLRAEGGDPGASRACAVHINADQTIEQPVPRQAEDCQVGEEDVVVRRQSFAGPGVTRLGSLGPSAVTFGPGWEAGHRRRVG